MKGLALLALLAAALLPGSREEEPRPAARTRAALLTPAQATGERLRELKSQGIESAVLELRDGQSGPEVRSVAERVRATGLALGYWIEVGRCPRLADAHPEWMASLQGHPEWRRLFPKAPQPGPGEVVKNYPWVPVLSREAQAAHLARVGELLRGLPPAARLYLNDLQAAPSACGCGNVLCRWTPDYGPIHTATRLPADAAARFVTEVGRLAPGAVVVPVWTSECEEGEKDAECAGVACFQGACWRDFTAQLMPVAAGSEPLGVLCLVRSFRRNLPRYGEEAGWIRTALTAFQEMPPKRGGSAVPMSRLVAVLQAWDGTEAERSAQVRIVERLGAAGSVLALTPIEQGWEPRLVPVGK